MHHISTIRHMKEKLIKLFTPLNCAWTVGIMMAITEIPIPAKWNIVLNSEGATLHDYRFYIAVYLILTILLGYMAVTTKYLFYKVVTWLSVGKLIDQFYNPYGWCLPEKLWDIMILIYLLKELHTWKKTKAAP